MSSINLAHIHLAALVLLCMGAGCTDPREEIAAESVTLPTGEVLTNESYLSVGRDRIRINRLYFQQSASSPRESLGEITEENASAIAPVPSSLFRSGDRVALVLGCHYVFKRWNSKDGPYWSKQNTNPDIVASLFLRSFLKPGDERIGNPKERSPCSWIGVPRLEAPYVFDHIDLDKNVLVTRRESSDTLFPQFLVYSATKNEFSSEFDLERTRAANGLTAPPDPNLVMDFSVVTYPGDLVHSKIESREDVLAIPGAEEILAQSVPLSFGTWRGIDCSFTIPTGTVVTERFEGLLGSADPWPHHLLIFWRSHPVLWNDWHFIRTNIWVRAAASGYKGNLSRIVFFRVRER